MNGYLKVIGSNNQIIPVGNEYNEAELIANKLIDFSFSSNVAASYLVLEEKVLTLDIKDVNICAKHVHVDTWFVDEESNGGRIEFELYWI